MKNEEGTIKEADTGDGDEDPVREVRCGNACFLEVQIIAEAITNAMIKKAYMFNEFTDPE